ncbi:MAG: PAS domain S-box protein [Proteobacteria bacterium]|nr:PAS domain S-box protein [Pseudomonadota bacterium]MBU1139857.1 PAS domain S-box protein [Pseudomonadota bacterium]MBU1232399.1 PAS domain S-box protein [Pseudomonadota bacterium]MBU1417186.1 PAS domain S-box protein [Pseudomonadota bacterium]MBU1453640.1 PAS domain S-box protein [Pseudomonadota bacterium]
MHKLSIPIPSAKALQAIINTTTDMIHLNTPDGLILYVNPITESILGYHAEELVGRPAMELIHPDDTQLIGEDMALIFSGAESIPREIRLRRKDHNFIYVEVKGFLVDSGKKSECIGAIIRDISKRKQREEELANYQVNLERMVQERTASLKEQQRFAAAIIDGLPSIFMLLDQDLHLLQVNKKLLQSLGYKTRQIDKTAALDLVMPEDRSAMNRQIEIIHRSGQAHFTSRLCRRTGGTIPFLFTGVPFSIEGKSCVILIGQDISKTLQMEAELLKKKKLESIGVLAGGMAHDLNNILTVIMGSLDMIAMIAAPGNEQFTFHISNAKSECRKINQLCEKLITFSKGGSPLKKEVHLNALIHECVIPIFADSSVQCTLPLLQDTPPLVADREQIRLVFESISRNALEAMAEGGHYSIDQQCITLGNDNPYSLPSGAYTYLTFTDSGKGIAQETLPSIFDPFFTTKAMGSTKGIGLGLSLAHSIIRKHGGAIEVNSSPGNGTIVTVCLPVSELHLQPAPPL